MEFYREVFLAALIYFVFPILVHFVKAAFPINRAKRDKREDSDKPE